MLPKHIASTTDGSGVLANFLQTLRMVPECSQTFCKRSGCFRNARKHLANAPDGSAVPPKHVGGTPDASVIPPNILQAFPPKRIILPNILQALRNHPEPIQIIYRSFFITFSQNPHFFYRLIHFYYIFATPTHLSVRWQTY